MQQQTQLATVAAHKLAGERKCEKYKIENDSQPENVSGILIQRQLASTSNNNSSNKVPEKDNSSGSLLTLFQATCRSNLLTMWEVCTDVGWRVT